MSSPTSRRGAQGEQRALDYLLSRGLVLVERNWRAKVGELDLVMRDGATLVVIEVRLRADDAFGGAAASVTFAKQARLRRAAQAYLSRHCGGGAWPCVRFDVVAIEGTRLHWIRAAF